MFMFLNRMMSLECGCSGAIGVPARLVIADGFVEAGWNDPPLKNIRKRGAPTNVPPAM